MSVKSCDGVAIIEESVKEIIEELERGDRKC